MRWIIGSIGWLSVLTKMAVAEPHRIDDIASFDIYCAGHGTVVGIRRESGGTVLMSRGRHWDTFTPPGLSFREDRAAVTTSGSETVFLYQEQVRPRMTVTLTLGEGRQRPELFNRVGYDATFTVEREGEIIRREPLRCSEQQPR